MTNTSGVLTLLASHLPEMLIELRNLPTKTTKGAVFSNAIIRIIPKDIILTLLSFQRKIQLFLDKMDIREN